MACTAGGELYSWGDNTQCQLGTQSASPCLDPKRVEGNLTGKIAKEIACGAYHSLCLTVDGEVGWRLGPPRKNVHFRLVLHFFSFQQVFTWGLNVGGQGTTANPLLVPFGSKALAVACGHNFSVVLLHSGEVRRDAVFSSVSFCRSRSSCLFLLLCSLGTFMTG